jgi:hypothetical protein
MDKETLGMSAKKEDRDRAFEAYRRLSDTDQQWLYDKITTWQEAKAELTGEGRTTRTVRTKPRAAAGKVSAPATEALVAT